MTDFEIAFLDHVAIRVADMEASAQWYEITLGLKRYKVEKWGKFPVFLLAGKTGVALFPANTNEPELITNSKNAGIDHYAFNVTQENFKKAKAHYESLQISYTFKDHFYFHSLYTKDPDGHTVELTTLVVDETDFY